MEKKQLRWPFFVVNPKSYLYGEDILKLAKYTDKLAEKYDLTFCSPRSSSTCRASSMSALTWYLAPSTWRASSRAVAWATFYPRHLPPLA